MIEPGWIGLVGAAGFGALIGWYVYYINRYRKSDVQFSDLTTVIGILGGAAMLNLFPRRHPCSARMALDSSWDSLATLRPSCSSSALLTTSTSTSSSMADAGR